MRRGEVLRKNIIQIVFLWGVLYIIGCTTMQENTGQMARFNIPNAEAEWIRNGDPIELEGEYWYPQDNVDILLDSEVEPLGEYRGVQFFIEKVDVKPYNHLYTKFGRNKFRIFQKITGDDSNSSSF